MRPYEIILVSALFLSLACSTFSLAASDNSATFFARLALLFTLCSAIVLVAHALLEGAHWQLLPAYAAILPVAILAWLAYRQNTSPAWPWQISCLLLLLISCACAYVIPMFRLPAPTGPYAVGTTIVYMVDHSRIDDAAPSPGTDRELIVQLWYPAVLGQGRVAAYRRRSETTIDSSYQAVLPTNSRLDAPVLRTAGTFPILFFNPAWRGRRTQDTFLTEELASHGYVVAAIDHTYNSMPVAFPDGRVAVVSPNLKIEGLHETTPAEVEAIGNHEADKQALDIRFVLDQLTGMNAEQGSRWYQTMDPANAGSLGHSLGGAVSMQAWATDARIHAALNMDGWTFGSQIEKASRTVPTDATPNPLLFLYGDEPPAPHLTAAEVAAIHKWTPEAIEAVVDAWSTDHVTRAIQNYGGYEFKIKGAIHATFTDKPLSSPFGRLSGASAINTSRAHLIIRDYVVQFFDQALKHKPSPLLDGKGTGYPEVITLIRVARPAARP